MESSKVVKSFQELSTCELYAILRLRNEVFVVEQACIFQDADNKDQDCYHLMLYNEGTLVAYARLVPPGVSYNEASIGRVVTSRQARGAGAGRLLMKAAIEYGNLIFGTDTIRIGAQAYLRSFYESLGFKATGIEYDEDGIRHTGMLLER